MISAEAQILKVEIAFLIELFTEHDCTSSYWNINFVTIVKQLSFSVVSLRCILLSKSFVVLDVKSRKQCRWLRMLHQARNHALLQ